MKEKKKIKDGSYIGGVKIEFTPEQIAEIRGALIGEGAETAEKASMTKLEKIPVGEMFKHCGYEFIVLEHLQTEQTVVCFKDFVKENVKFGENNNYDGSDVDDICWELAEEITDTVEFTLDLTSDDGLDDYGTVDREVALMTTDMYRKYVSILDKHKLNKWWWLATPWSTATHGETDWVKCVSPSGYFYFNYGYCNGNGVRPFCILKSNIFVS